MIQDTQVRRLKPLFSRVVPGADELTVRRKRIDRQRHAIRA